MDPQTTLVGTGFVVLAAVVWIVCAVYAYQNAPKFGRRAAVWTFLCILFGPIALMILYILPKKQPVHAAGSSHAHTDPQAALYEVPKKKH
jgi:multisubunit Na+/H+ antiporter MnhB subunit